MYSRRQSGLLTQVIPSHKNIYKFQFEVEFLFRWPPLQLHLSAGVLTPGVAAPTPCLRRTLLNLNLLAYAEALLKGEGGGFGVNLLLAFASRFTAPPIFFGHNFFLSLFAS